MIRCEGPVGVPRTSNWRPPERVALKAHPVATVAPSTNEPSGSTTISCPELEAKVPVAPLLSTKSRSLINCPTLVGFVCKSVRMIVTTPEPIVKVADAFTGCPPEVEPEGVTNVTLSARAQGVKIAASVTGSIIHKAFLINFGHSHIDSLRTVTTKGAEFM